MLLSIFEIWDFVVPTLSARLAERWRAISTRQLMKIEIPEGNLDLSEDIPMITFNSSGVFPKDLETITNRELRQILIELDFTLDTTQGSGTRDWGKLSDRMNFIADFFRSAQQYRKFIQAAI